MRKIRHKKLMASGTAVDEAQASPANAEYNCELYIDLNCDGNFSKSEKLDDIAVMQNGNVIKKENGIYQLSLNTTYTLSRKIPQEYINAVETGSHKQ